jgi:cystathionine beta-lyase
VPRRLEDPEDIAHSGTSFVFDDFTPATLRRRGSIKWARYGPDVLACWVGEMDFRTAPVVRQAVGDAVERDEFGYPQGDDRNGIPEAVVGFLAGRYGWKVQADRVHSLPDVLKGVELAIRHFSPEGSAVILPTPAYMPFFDVPVVTRRPLMGVPSRLEAGVWRLDLEGIESAFGHGAGTIVLCQPHNPLGRSFSADEMVQLAAVVDRYGGRVVSDEIHAPLTYEGAVHVPYASLSEMTASHTITVTSASKAWNLPGLKCAQVVTSNEVDERRWRAIPRLETHGASTVGLAANLAAYRDGGPWLAAALSYLDGNRHYLAELLAEHLPEIGYTVPEATYLAWLDCRGLGLDSEPADYFLERAHLATNPGPAFGTGGAGHVRFNFATSRTIIAKAVAAMAASVADRRRRH